LGDEGVGHVEPTVEREVAMARGDDTRVAAVARDVRGSEAPMVHGRMDGERVVSEFERPGMMRRTWATRA